MATAPYYPAGIAGIGKTIVNSDSTNWVDVYDNTAGSTPVRIENLTLCSDDTSTVNIQFSRVVGGTSYLIGTARAATLSGTDGAAASVNALSIIGSIGSDGVLAYEVAAGGKLQAKSIAAVTAAKTVTITGWGRTY